jgi:hypothetical protein
MKFRIVALSSMTITTCGSSAIRIDPVSSKSNAGASRVTAADCGASPQLFE